MDIYIYDYIYTDYMVKNMLKTTNQIWCTDRRRMHMLIILLDVSDEGYGVLQ
jgi:hypothetical protein